MTLGISYFTGHPLPCITSGFFQPFLVSSNGTVNIKETSKSITSASYNMTGYILCCVSYNFISTPKTKKIVILDTKVNFPTISLNRAAVLSLLENLMV